MGKNDPAQGVGNVRKALLRHTAKTVIVIDDDCTVNGPLTPLSRIDGDVGFFIGTRFRKNGSTKIGIRSGTIVVRPVRRALDFVDAWIAEGQTPDPTVSIRIA
ncbi:MAG: hypothetical protein B7Y80_19280 [Hyphomicrobium sp. 32-62-53]|nr:MAG: hypothetical protein B7Z29_17925 [Hyphomicrobium sp. 12-62-95]OYX97563.1 MAG: hypothetical protein B7Y80_19280 [Hyphomicrobium sp. 32-62-53]